MNYTTSKSRSSTFHKQQYDDSVYESLHLHAHQTFHKVIIVYLSPFSHIHRAFPYTTFPTQTGILFVLTRPNTNLTQYEVWDSLGGQCKGYSLLARDTVQFSILSPEYWIVQHSEDCGNMYLSNVGTQNMIKNATVYPKVSYEGV